jgi:hypothetical protein
VQTQLPERQLAWKIINKKLKNMTNVEKFEDANALLDLEMMDSVVGGASCDNCAPGCQNGCKKGCTTSCAKTCQPGNKNNNQGNGNVIETTTPTPTEEP